MLLLMIGIALFWAAHGLKINLPEKRAALAARVGDLPVKGGVAVALIASVALMAAGYQQAAFVAVWTPPGYLVHLNNVLMVVALALFTAGGFRSRIADKIRHPQLAGVKVWAVAHLLVNGDAASILLFGSMLAWAVFAMISINRRDGKGPVPARGTMVRTVAHLVGTLVIFVGVALVHNHLGVWPFAGSPP